MKMVYSVEQDTFIAMSCNRNETFVNEEFLYSAPLLSKNIWSNTGI